MRRLYIIDIKKQRKLFFVLPLALFAAIFLFLGTNYSFTVFSNQNEPKALNTGNPDHPSVALTFNISHGSEQVEPILNELAKSNVTATFFVSGEWAERHPDLFDKIKEAKHEIGMLGYRYAPYEEQDNEKIRQDIAKARETFKKLGSEDVYLFRTPNGYLNKDLLQMVENQGLKMIHWSINPNDWKNPGTEVITDRILTKVDNGSIVLLHASDSVKQTDKALANVVPELKQRKLAIVTISELITHAEGSQEELKSNKK
ncbi:polysaccharide deacetylase family sporulation protein PdaB [Gracilibacillus ureilyticus]|uniref:Polysaccharide deacetylase family sporulation protein PdaB n=1 Tax=Gracilibacillus ureilyticus TaxID=531814 RepID=A0A1H9VGT5_9BACI|nr:polysaccharide deacetylase family protein [Gracilibacillus ureilyticus]SES20779.1 polysaccharide deacetylase family sporulation protein PdaB [Gracilibacillus ureilyticus]